ncbi:MAG: MFS transporter [Bacteroides sp.]|nr:MFS transporter [Bacillota bacterium]MCM1456169.1 MFS transporter [Bacteroides sp.]
MTDLINQKPQKRFIGLTGNMWLYALGLMGINFAIGLVNSYQAEFFNKILQADLIAIAIIILVAKFVSIIADFVIGNLIDRANFKAGKMRPWILMSAFPLAVFTTLSFAFIPFGSGTGATVGKYIYITVIMILWNVSMTMADIPVSGTLSLVTNNAADTNNAAGIANTLRSISLACPGVFIMIMGLLVGDDNGVSWLTYLITAIVLSVLGLIFQLLMYFKGREQYKSSASSGMSFKEMFGELKNNKMILLLFLTFILGFGRNIGLGIAVQASCILIRDGIDLSFIGMGVLTGDQCSWAIGLTSAISSLVTIILNPVINKKLGEKKYFIIAGFYGFAVSLIGFIMYMFGGKPLRSIWAIFIYQFLLGFSYGPNGYLPMVMTADIVDYQEWKTGRRTEGTQFAILSMSNKLSNALSVSLGLLFIGAIGYNSADYFSTLEQGAAISAYVTNTMQDKAWAIYFLLPGLCMLASSIVMFFYKIDEKTKKVMREELAIRHAAQNAQTSALNDAVNLGVNDVNGIDVLSRAEGVEEIIEENREETNNESGE